MTKVLYKVLIFFALSGTLIFAYGCSSSPQKNPYRRKQESLLKDSEESFHILTIGTADSGGTMYPVGSAIADAISSHNNNIKVNISASNGSMTNVEEIIDGQIDLGLVSGDVAFLAYHGTEEFADEPATGLRVIAAVYSSTSNWLAPISSGLFYVHDLEGKRIAVGPQDSTTDFSARTALDTIGLDSSNTILKNFGLGSGGMEVKKGNLDALHGFAGIPINGLSELAETVPSRLLEYTDQELKEILSKNPYYYKAIIPANTYVGQLKDVETFGVKCLICVDEDMDEELVYNLTKVLDESRTQLAAVHPTMASMEDVNFMCHELPVPLHKGAKRYYEEAGYLDPS